MLITDVTNAFNRRNIDYAIVGGYAVSLHGAVRGTVDLDLIITLSEEQMQAAELALVSLGFSSRLPVTAKDVFQYRNEYIKNRNLVAWSFYKPASPLDVVDILITETIEDIEVEQVKALGTKLNVASINSLIRIKEKSGRKQDLEDIKALKTIQMGGNK